MTYFIDKNIVSVAAPGGAKTAGDASVGLQNTVTHAPGATTTTDSDATSTFRTSGLIYGA